MNQWRRVLRSAAVVSSVILVGGFIAYSARLTLMMAGSKSNPAFQFVPAKTPPKQSPKPEPPPEQPKYPSRSKLTFNFIDNDVKQPGEQKSSAAPTTPAAGQKPGGSPNPSR